VVRRFAFPAVSQIGINYRHSSLSNHAGDQDFEVKAGDRMPYFLVDGQNIFDRLQQPRFHLLVFASDPNAFQKLKDELATRYAQVDFHAISHSHEVAEVFGTNKEFMVLLRPDNHIAFMSSDISSGAIREYFVEFIGTL
jgi:Aromatic-ring hydroxylase, C-terminal